MLTFVSPTGKWSVVEKMSWRLVKLIFGLANQDALQRFSFHSEQFYHFQLWKPSGTETRWIVLLLWSYWIPTRSCAQCLLIQPDKAVMKGNWQSLYPYCHLMVTNTTYRQLPAAKTKRILCTSVTAAVFQHSHACHYVKTEFIW